MCVYVCVCVCVCVCQPIKRMTTVMRMRGNDYLEKQTDMVHYFLFRLARDYFMEHGRISGEFRQGGKNGRRLRAK